MVPCLRPLDCFALLREGLARLFMECYLREITREWKTWGGISIPHSPFLAVAIERFNLEQCGRFDLSRKWGWVGCEAKCMRGMCLQNSSQLLLYNSRGLRSENTAIIQPLGSVSKCSVLCSSSTTAVFWGDCIGVQCYSGSECI